MSDRIPVTTTYQAASALSVAGEEAWLSLLASLDRPEVSLSGRIRQPLVFRDALLTLHRIIGSDLRAVPKDRTAWLMWLRRRQGESVSRWQAQQDYFAWLAENDPTAWAILDPILTVHPDALLMEAFSRDEGSYACLQVDLDAFELDGPPALGSTNIDLSAELVAALQGLRSFRQARLKIGAEAVSLQTEGAGVLQKRIPVPQGWLRGFLQVQSAAALPLDRITLSTIDLYNVLRLLRLRGDRKGERRAIRVELEPGKAPRLVMEPWGEIITGTGGVWRGAAKVVRLWGRRRLLMLQSMLPITQSVEVAMAGSGLPAFWTLRGEGVSMTLGLTGFIAANWSAALGFDLLLPPRTAPEPVDEAVLSALSAAHVTTLAALIEQTGAEPTAARRALQIACQQGLVMIAPDGQTVRYRPLTSQPLPLNQLEHGGPRHRAAAALLDAGAVVVERERRIPGEGVELTGAVEVVADERTYRPQLVLADGGRARRVSCTCSVFRTHRLKEGPCAHLIALRIRYGRMQAAGSARVLQTRVFSRRRAGGEEIHELTRDERRLLCQWGLRGGQMRSQRLEFNTEAEAEAALQRRAARLLARGFLDATAG